MKQQRLDGLADGIFAIVMTLLVIEMKVPVFLGGHPTDAMLINALAGTWNIFMSLVLSFALLFTYWRAHHFIASVYVKNLTVGLANINAIFFFFITLVPFVAHFLGEFPHSQIAVTLYGITVIAIGLSLFYMRMYVERNINIETSVITKADRRSGYIRILFPVFSAAVAILLSYWNTTFSMVLFTIAIMFNLFPASSNIMHRWLDLIFSDDNDLVKGNYDSPMNEMMKNEEFICVPKSAVFDHHRFKEVDTKARATLVKNDKTTKKIKTQITKESKLDKELEKEIIEEIKDGSVEELIVKKEE
ncbi:MAG: TMEM175 family protein [Candidatus Pacebacteria bacterium]|nr:TMEM175 family protein [Candidatus Paceibacterota bacterium]